MNKKIIISIVHILFLMLLASAAGATDILDGFLESPEYGKPFLTEMHSTLIKIELGWSKSYDEFTLKHTDEKFNRPVVEAHLGVQIPLYSIHWGKEGNKPAWGIGLTLPVSIHVLEDMFEDITAPVINTDYRFGAPRIMVMRNLSDTGFIRNISASWLPIFHECTHLGDEITIDRRDSKIPITRINVSYEYTEFQITLNDPADIRDNLHSFRFGLLCRLSDRGYGWFGARPGPERDPDVYIAKSERRVEYYFEYQFQRSEGFLANKRAVNVFSFEARNRVRYGYPIYKMENDVWVAKDIKENSMWTINLYLGYKFYSKSAIDNNRPDALGVYFHFYRGLNPYGQLRNYPGYPFFGVSLVYDF
jgi:hypothetical protein